MERSRPHHAGLFARNAPAMRRLGTLLCRQRNHIQPGTLKNKDWLACEYATGDAQLVGYGQCNKRRTTSKGASRRAGATPLQLHSTATLGQRLQGRNYCELSAAILPGWRFGYVNIVGEIFYRSAGKPQTRHH